MARYIGPPPNKISGYASLLSATPTGGTGMTHSLGTTAGYATYKPTTLPKLGYIDDKSGQFKGNYTGHRRMETLQALLAKGDTGTLNKAEWALLSKLNKGAHLSGTSLTAGGNTAVGDAIGPDGLPVLNNDNMTDMANINSAKFWLQQDEDNANSGYTNNATTAAAQSRAMLAQLMRGYGRSVRGNGLAAAGQGASSNPALSGLAFVQGREDLATGRKQQEVELSSRIAQYLAARNATIAEINRRRQQLGIENLATTSTNVSV